MNAQLLLSGTPEELQEILSLMKRSNGVTSGNQDSLVNPMFPKGQVKESEIPSVVEFKTAKQKSKAEKQKALAKVEEPAEEEDDDETTDDEDEKSDITIEELRLLVQTKAKAGKRDQIKKLLTSLGASSVTELDEDKYQDFKAGLEKL